MRTLTGPADGFDPAAQSFPEPATGATDTLQWILSDHLNSASVTANADGTWNSTIQYTAFGEVRASKGMTATRYRYTGQLAQDSVGLDYYVARWYDPVTGHFTSADTIVPSPWLTGAYDRYTYVLNNPIHFNDPSGFRPAGECEKNEECRKTKWTEAEGQKNELLQVVGNEEINGCKGANCIRGLEIAAFVASGLVGSAVLIDATVSLTIGSAVSSSSGAASAAETVSAACSSGKCTEGLQEASKIGNALNVEISQSVGKLGESASGIIKNTLRIPSLTDTAKYRIPDQLFDDSQKLLTEVKNVDYQSLTNQIKDSILYSQKIGLNMELITRETTILSAPLQKIINEGIIIHITMNLPH